MDKHNTECLEVRQSDFYSRLLASHTVVHMVNAAQLRHVLPSVFFSYAVCAMKIKKTGTCFSRSLSGLINIYETSYHVVIKSSLNMTAKPTSPLAFVAYWNIVQLQSITCTCTCRRRA